MNRRDMLLSATLMAAGIAGSQLSSSAATAATNDEKKTPARNVNEAVVRYLAAWNERDASRRLELVAKAWTEDGTYLDRVRHGRGHNEIDAMIATAQAHFPGYQLHLASGDTGQALSAARAVLGVANQYQMPLEQGAAHRLLGEVHEAMGARAEAEAAFRRSLEILGNIESRPELAQTLLAYGRFRRGDNMLEDRALIERALALFKEMNATGWIEEARGALTAA